MVRTALACLLGLLYKFLYFVRETPKYIAWAIWSFILSSGERILLRISVPEFLCYAWLRVMCNDDHRVSFITLIDVSYRIWGSSFVTTILLVTQFVIISRCLRCLEDFMHARSICFKQLFVKLGFDSFICIGMMTHHRENHTMTHFTGNLYFFIFLIKLFTNRCA